MHGGRYSLSGVGCGEKMLSSAQVSGLVPSWFVQVDLSVGFSLSGGHNSLSVGDSEPLSNFVPPLGAGFNCDVLQARM